jgi:hypothetical protein
VTVIHSFNLSHLPVGRILKRRQRRLSSVRKLLRFLVNALWCVLGMILLYILIVGGMVVYMRWFMKIEVAG